MMRGPVTFRGGLCALGFTQTSLGCRSHRAVFTPTRQPGCPVSLTVTKEEYDSLRRYPENVQLHVEAMVDFESDATFKRGALASFSLLSERDPIEAFEDFVNRNDWTRAAR